MFARQLEAFGRTGDLLVLISTSGSSANCLRAAEAAHKALGMAMVGLLGRDGGRLKGMVDVAIVVSTEDTALAQEIQLAIDHQVCSVIEGSSGGRVRIGR